MKKRRCGHFMCRCVISGKEKPLTCQARGGVKLYFHKWSQQAQCQFCQFVIILYIPYIIRIKFCEWCHGLQHCPYCHSFHVFSDQQWAEVVIDDLKPCLFTCLNAFLMVRLKVFIFQQVNMSMVSDD